MGSVKITLTEINRFGSELLKFPSSAVVANSQIFVVDRQNNKIQIFDLDGVFVSEFGSVGTGNDNFSLPEGIQRTAAIYILLIPAP